MAVTIDNEPQPWQTSDNPLLYQFISDQAGEENFSYKIEQKVDGQIVYTDKIFPEVADASHFNASDIAKVYTPKPTRKTDLHQEAATVRTIQLVVTENYGTPPVDQLSASSAVTSVFKARVSDREFLQNDYSTFELSRWFTDHPTLNMSILRQEDKIVSMLGAGTLAAATFNFYDASGVLLHTYITPNQTYDVWMINTSESNLTGTAGVPDITLVSYFTIQIGASDILTLTYFDDYCYIPVSVNWINKFGAYDSFIFSHANIESGSVKASGYKKQFGQWDGTNFTYDLQNSGAKDYFKSNDARGKLVSEYMSQELQNWLTTIYMGLDYQATYADGETFPIRVTKSRYELKLRRFEDLINEQVDYEINTGDHSPLL